MCVNICKTFLWGNDVCSNDKHTQIYKFKHTQKDSERLAPGCATQSGGLAAQPAHLRLLLLLLFANFAAKTIVRTELEWAHADEWIGGVGGGCLAVCVYFVLFYFFLSFFYLFFSLLADFFWTFFMLFFIFGRSFFIALHCSILINFKCQTMNSFFSSSFGLLPLRKFFQSA